MNHEDATPVDRYAKLQDPLLAGGLVLVLAIVFWLDRGPPPAKSNQLPVVKVSVEVVQLRSLRLAVTPPQFDDMGKLLTSLGKGYGYKVLPLEGILDLSQVQAFDILFLTCGGVPESWLAEKVGDAAREGVSIYAPNEAVIGRVSNNLRAFVEQGGVLYASDWRFDLIARSFPEAVDPSNYAEGDVQKVKAKVLDSRLREILGETAEVNFDKPGWISAAFHRARTEVLLEGAFQTVNGDRKEAPLLVRFPHGKGSVIFTSFHNEKQHSEIETQLLNDLS